MNTSNNPALSPELNSHRLGAMNKYRSTVLSPFKFGMWLIIKMPIAWLAGVRLRELDQHHCVTSVPFKWLSQNPFKSIYFATQAMAAELSTGALTMMSVQGLNPSVSMLITEMKAEYGKKAGSKVFFECTEGDRILQTVNRCVEQDTAESVSVQTIGRLEDGTEVSRFTFTWSLKRRSRK